jgi:diguanylate cyclase (GGDEF)-like protein
MTDEWSVHLLTEYFSAVSAPENEQLAVEVAVALAAESLDAEVGAAVVNGEIRATWGLGAQSVPAELVSVARGAHDLAVPGLGVLFSAVGDLGRNVSGALIVARARNVFGPQERQMLHAMAQVLGLALRGMRTLGAERSLREEREREAEERLKLLAALSSRQRLLETMLSIQRAISNRKPLQDVLDAITKGASGLLDNAVVALVRQAGADQLGVASTFGLPVPHSPSAGPPGSRADPMPGGEALPILATASDAMDSDGVVTRAVTADDGESGIMIATPVHVSGGIEGSLVAYNSASLGHVAEHRELLAAFAQQVSLALTDARTVQAMRDAYHDSITGLPNRALFLERLKESLADVARADAREVAVLFVDLDHFKAVNDSLGHTAGDELLADVARRILACLRTTDVAARLGGDEFAVMLEGSDCAAAVAMGERIIRAVREPFWIAGRDVFVDASVGVASSRNCTADAATLLSNADVAMYHVKKSGPGRTAVFEPYMHSAVLKRLELHSDLQHAIALNELSLQYQPLVGIDSAEPVGVEALLRWTHPRRGRVTPTEFIPTAEETGLIVEIGRWVLWESTRQMVEWHKVIPDLTLNVNVSARQIADRGFVSDVSSVLAATGMKPHLLSLELTESVLMSDPDNVLPRLRHLKSLGVRLSVDDFGTGYSSLAYLCQFPVDELKIDRSFISGICTTTSNLAIVRTIIELAKTLHLQTVAEGIEDHGQLEALERLGCDIGQGFYLARPLDPGPAYSFITKAIAPAL